VPSSSSVRRPSGRDEGITADGDIVSGGFATVQPNSVLSINAVEGYPLEDFSAEAVRAQIAEAQKVANGSGSEQDIAEAKIELEVCGRSTDCTKRGRPTDFDTRFSRPCPPM
jgi:hypothetical protein